MRKIMRALLIMILTASVVAAQSKADFRKKYGEPISETFSVRSGINATVTYTSSGEITELLIAPQITSLVKSGNYALALDIVKNIINELVPAEARGKFLMGSFLNLACLPKNDCAGSAEDYEKLTIYYNAGQNGVSYAVVKWKK
jgi:hypothetical protein